MAELGKRLTVFLIGNLVVWGVLKGVENIADGKTVLGKTKKPKEKTYVDWKGNVHLGKIDYAVV